ncbi:peptidase S41 [Rhodocytophaga rosea]|uniref:Peptidase S41 n=1 Tax=Rhodocytophaga rosea TaxID=2704465 RepID=A0A6C0GJJ6_9BACT|nr:S41 family peptidase [Rhodocytophaga rosea]QHT67832.1 peptidase S41 [Rhodocytophaga rosea]
MIKLNAQTLQRRFNSFNQKSIWLALLAFTLFASACEKEIDETSPTPTTENQTVNDWILENMQMYYYWNEQIPANPDKSQSAEDFFNSLLYTYDATARPDGDRFSFMSENAEELEASLSGQEQTTGAEYTFYLASQGSNDVIAQVIYVLPGSPADQAGLKRGDIVFQVNGQTLDRSNYYSLLFGQSSQTLGLGIWQNNELVKGNLTKNVSTAVVQENPVYLDSTYTVGDKKIGYVVYNQFIPSPSGTENGQYDKQLDQIFGNFKSEGINELILDLRYNPGGYVSSATNLASLIGKNIDANKVFYSQEWNSVLAPELEKEYGADYGTEYFVAKPQNIGNHLNRVYVLTSDHTASASELIINGLRPYMEVITVGSTTVGKNVGSITITDDTERFKLALQPIVFKSYNSLGQSDYTTGFTPTIEANETIDLKPLGDVEETVLNTTLSHITGVRTARLGVSERTLPMAGSSIERKAGGSNMFDKRILNLPAIVQ